MKNKTILALLALFSVMLSSSIANAIEVSIENYYPTPVEAGNYFNVWLKISNREVSPVVKSSVNFKPSYPFSLDPGEEKEIVIDTLGPGSSVTKNFKIRVDKEAKEGGNNIVFEFKNCESCVVNQKTMSITVMEYQTMFDVVLQEVTSEGVFIAIANIGKNPANAVTVSIPEQESFRTEMVSSSIVGNLASGDYTVAGFKILPQQIESDTSQQTEQDVPQKKEWAPQQAGTAEKKPLSIQIAYTDPFGVRRTVIRQVLLSPASLSKVNMMAAGAAMARQNSKGFTKDVWFWTSAGLAVIIALLAWKRARRKD